VEERDERLVQLHSGRYVPTLQQQFTNIVEERDDNTEAVFVLDNRSRLTPTTSVSLCESQVTMLVDSGASVILINQATFASLRRRPTLKFSETVIYGYNSTTSLPIEGEFRAVVAHRNSSVEATFIVVKSSSKNILGFQTAELLNIIKIVNEIAPIEDYPELFTGKVGKLKNFQAKFHINKDIHPVAQPYRRIPYQRRKAVEAELERMELEDIIEKASGPTSWVSPIVVVPKPQSGCVRICSDAREANRALIRERGVSPLLEEILYDLNNAKFLSKIDLKSGYHQVEIHPDSRYITTFATHAGLYIYKRLTLGMSPASDIFQSVISQVIQGISGAVNISDDILVHGSTQEEHDERLRSVLERLLENGLTINRDKAVFNKSEVEFFGLKIGSNGVALSDFKIKAL
jgi:hypothetical protein